MDGGHHMNIAKTLGVRGAVMRHCYAKNQFLRNFSFDILLKKVNGLGVCE